MQKYAVFTFYAKFAEVYMQIIKFCIYMHCPHFADGHSLPGGSIYSVSSYAVPSGTQSLYPQSAAVAGHPSYDYGGPMVEIVVSLRLAGRQEDN